MSFTPSTTGFSFAALKSTRRRGAVPSFPTLPRRNLKKAKLSPLVPGTARGRRAHPDGREITFPKDVNADLFSKIIHNQEKRK